MKSLQDICSILPSASVHGDDQVMISRVIADSRAIQEGDLFFPRKGASFDGYDFIDDAIAQGASAVVVSKKINAPIPQLIAPSHEQVLKQICLHLYNKPTEKFHVVGVTGTNGKTSICHFVEAIFKYVGQKTGYIGTTEYRWGNKKISAPLTTPMFEMLQFYFAQMQKDQVDSLAMECSSHGIELGRIDHIAFDTCIFTNLTHEHLDFHENMENYAQTKKKLFTHHLKNSSKEKKCAVINISDPVGKKWLEEEVFEKVITYGLTSDADIYPVTIDSSSKGMQVRLSVMGQEVSFFMSTIGTYNVMNMMAAMAACKNQGVDLKVMIEAIEQGIDVPGRLQKIPVAAPFSVIVDYAYTEDALRNVLKTLIPHRKNRIIVVFGCGGDRDATRRPKMAQAVFKYADQIIVTTDNPRTEEPQSIIDEIILGIDQEPTFDQKVTIEVDRKKAIIKAVHMARPDDIVLIAGKGHETYQEVHGVRHPFDDREIAKQAILEKVS